MREALAPALAEVGSKMVSLASVESNADLATALKRLGKTWEAAGSIAQAQVGYVCVRRNSRVDMR